MGPFENRDHQEKLIRLWKAHLLKHTRRVSRFPLNFIASCPPIFQLASEPVLFNTYNWDTACNSIIRDIVTSLVPQWCGTTPSPSKPLPPLKLVYSLLRVSPLIAFAGPSLLPHTPTLCCPRRSTSSSLHRSQSYGLWRESEVLFCFCVFRALKPR
jgi:hypothetical protein